MCRKNIFFLLLLSVYISVNAQTTKSFENRNSLDIYVGPDSFRSIPSGSWSGNSGALIEADMLFSIKKNPFIVGALLGGSYGLYDWDNRGFSASLNQTALEQQGFFSAGMFFGSNHPYGIDLGICYDLMISTDYGVFAVAPLLDQIRAKLGVTLNNNDQIGAWFTHYIQTVNSEINQVPLVFRAIPQVNAYWSHFFKNSSRLTLWAGSPYSDSLMYSSGRAGSYIVGADFKAKLLKHLSINGTWTYMGAKGDDPFARSSNYGNNIGFFITYSFGEADNRVWIPSANNSNFLVDTNANQ